MSLMETKNLTKVFPSGTVAVDGVTLNFERNRVYSVVGPSGSGKTTLLRMMCQLEKPTSGEIVVDGITLGRDRREDRRALLKTGLVFQSFNLFPHLTVLQNVSVPQTETLGRSRHDADSVAMELLGKVRLADKADSYPCSLSGGQSQRVAVARALALEPEILFFDEPTSALDPETIKGLGRMLREFADRITMVTVTHEIAFAKDLSTDIVFMENGNLVYSGTSVEAFSSSCPSERFRKFSGCSG